MTRVEQLKQQQRIMGHKIKLTANLLSNGSANQNSPLSYQLTNAINVIIRCSIKIDRMSYLKIEDIPKAGNILKQIANIISNGGKFMTRKFQQTKSSQSAVFAPISMRMTRRGLTLRTRRVDLVLKRQKLKMALNISLFIGLQFAIICVNSIFDNKLAKIPNKLGKMISFLKISSTALQ